MRIQVLSDDFISPQACTYAEYRLFEALSHAVDAARVRSARLELRRTKQNRHSGSVSCTIIIENDRGEVLRIRAIGGHPYAAINHAIERIERSGRRARPARPPVLAEPAGTIDRHE